MSDVLIREIYLDLEHKRQCDADGIAVLADSQMSLPRMASRVIVRAHLYLSGTTYFQPAAGAAWYFALDNVFEPTTPALDDPVATVDSDFNNAADWSSVSVTEGKICFPVNTTTSELAAKFAAAPSSLPMYGELWMNDPVSGWSPLVRWDVTVDNVVANFQSTTPLAQSLGSVLVKKDGDDTVIYFPDGSVAQRYSPS